MANVTLLNADYQDVPYILLPKTGGGQAEFYAEDAELGWLGKKVESLGEIYSISYLLKNTSFNGWTPSTTAKTIVSSKNVSPTVALDMANYEYAIRWKFDCDYVYDGSETDVARTLRTIADAWQLIQRRANSLANVQADNPAGNACATLATNPLMEYWSDKGSHTYTWAASYGIYPGMTAAAFSNSTSLTPTLTIKTPTVSARCSNTYFSTANAGHVDQDETTIKIKGYLYRYKPQGILCNLYRLIDALYATPL